MTISQEVIDQLSQEIENTIQEQVEQQVNQLAPAAFLGIFGTVLRNVVEVDGKIQVVLDEDALNLVADMIYTGVNSLGYHVESKEEEGGMKLYLTPLSSAVEGDAANV